MKYALTLSLLVLPAITHAQRFRGTTEIIEAFGGIINALLPIAVGLALLAFFWGLAKFIYNTGKGDTAAVETGRSLMVWGIIALFVIVSIWGIIAFIGRELNINNTISGGGGGGFSWDDIF